MIWQEEMKRSAVRVAFPDWILHSDDTILFSVYWEDGYNYSEDSFDSDRFVIAVQVNRSSTGERRFATFENKNAGSFFSKLMRRADYEDVHKLTTMQRIAKREALADLEVQAKKKTLGLTQARDIYDTAMRWVNVSDAIREKVHHLAQQYDGKPSNTFGFYFGDRR